MTKNEYLDEFLKRAGIELLPFQKEIIGQIIDENRVYICYPPHFGRTNILLMMQAIEASVKKGENYGSRIQRPNLKIRHRR
jgi:hypothetical protein